MKKLSIILLSLLLLFLAFFSCENGESSSSSSEQPSSSEVPTEKGPNDAIVDVTIEIPHKNEGKDALLIINNNAFRANGYTKILDDSVELPLVQILEALGCEIIWHTETVATVSNSYYGDLKLDISENNLSFASSSNSEDLFKTDDSNAHLHPLKNEIMLSSIVLDKILDKLGYSYYDLEIDNEKNTVSLCYSNYELEDKFYQVNNLRFELSSDGTYYSVSSYDFSSSVSGEKRDVVIPAFYEGIPVTKIESNAFERSIDEPMMSNDIRKYAEIITLTIPETVTEIETYALSPLSLKKIIVSENNPVYSSLDGILYSKDKATLISYPKGRTDQTVTISEGTQTIAKGAFYGCTRICYLTLPSTLKSIESSAFTHCTSLLSVSLPEALEKIEENAFQYCYKLVEIINKSALSLEKGTETNGRVVENALIIHSADSILEKTDDGYVFIKDNATDTYYLLAYNGSDGTLILPENSKFGKYKIYKFAFSSNKTIYQIFFSADVTEIGNDAFRGCNKLIKVEINDMEAYLKAELLSYSSSPFYSGGADLFVNGVRQTSLVTPSTVTEIKANAFCGCASLESLVITDNIIAIGENAFESNLNLIELKAGSGLESIGNNAFRSCSMNKISFSEGLKTIGSFAFAYNFQIEEIILPNGVTQIGKAAFFNCPALKSATLGVGLTCIEESLFGGANKLESVNIPEGVKEIKAYAFMDCYALKEIYIPSTTESIGDYAFWYCKSLIAVRMPYGINISKTAFKNCIAGRKYY